MGRGRKARRRVERAGGIFGHACDECADHARRLRRRAQRRRRRDSSRARGSRLGAGVARRARRLQARPSDGRGQLLGVLPASGRDDRGAAGRGIDRRAVSPRRAERLARHAARRARAQPDRRRRRGRIGAIGRVDELHVAAQSDRSHEAQVDGLSGGRRKPRSDRQADLAEVLAGRLMGERVGDVVERERAIDDRLDAGCVDRAHHVDLMPATADDQALQVLLARHQRDGRHRAGNPRQHADQCDMAADPACLDRLRERVGAADLDHVVDAAPVRQREHLRRPVRVATIVDDVIGAERACAFQLFVRRRRGDHGRAHSLRELQREDRYAARAEHEHAVARLQAAVDDERAPCGEARRRQRRGLLVRVALRRMREPVRGAHDRLARVAVDTVARDRREVRDGRPAVEPVRKKGRHDRVAGRELRDAFADRFDDTCAVGHWNALVGGVQPAGDDAEIVIVERTRVNAHADFAGGRCTGIGERDAFEMLEAGGLTQHDGFHRFDSCEW
ncbi:hypothetical protein BURPS1710b_3182 [Burkholderia pseudomallei 1710b]|uniref:Uncharacterized protein n=1 Tax=Burkholderia pseudomallei (strain 1710b) TaxID=320372 RepID=Q3JPF0_BURP1|nr:hypothetical protein BURPS1710b_3182 [Burkholderia pseudomallei 1710b]